MVLFLTVLCMLHLNACTKNQPVTEPSTETSMQEIKNTKPAENQNIESDLEETISPEELMDAFGIPVLLPWNPNWIKKREYQLDESGMKISYYDAMAEANCTVQVANGGELDLPDHAYDGTLDEAWEGRTISNKVVPVKVQHSIDNKDVLATWEYGSYKFAIQGNIPGDPMDSSSIPKTAIYIIQNLE